MRAINRPGKTLAYIHPLSLNFCFLTDCSLFISIAPFWSIVFLVFAIFCAFQTQGQDKDVSLQMLPWDMSLAYSTDSTQPCDIPLGAFRGQVRVCSVTNHEVIDSYLSTVSVWKMFGFSKLFNIPRDSSAYSIPGTPRGGGLIRYPKQVFSFRRRYEIFYALSQIHYLKLLLFRV